MNYNKNMERGFSLIEVIVAVAILAVLSMPILLYFTNAAIHSAHGKHEQAADVAVQSVVEEIDAVTDLKILQNNLVGTNGWELTSVPDPATSSVPSSDPSAGPMETSEPSPTPVGTTGPTASSNPNVFALKKPITIDYDGGGEREFVARVVVDYSGYVASAEANKANKFNSYNNPHLPEVYNDSNIIISESDETEAGVYDLFHKLNGSYADPTKNSTVSDPNNTMDMIRNKAVRNFEISVIKETDSDDVFVKGGYKLTYNSKESHVVIKAMKLNKNDLRNIYFLFKPLDPSVSSTSSSSQAELYFDDSMSKEDFKNMSISFIRQNEYALKTPTTVPTATPTTTPDGGGSITTPLPVGNETIYLDGKYNDEGNLAVGQIDQYITITAVTAGGNSNWNDSEDGIKFYGNSNVYMSGVASFNKSRSDDEITADVDAKDKGNLWMVDSPKENRIAKIYVYVWPKDEYTDDKVDGFLAKAETTKSN